MVRPIRQYFCNYALYRKFRRPLLWAQTSYFLTAFWDGLA